MDSITIDSVKIALEKELKDLLLNAGIVDYNIDVPFLEMGLNSIAFVKLIVNMEKKFNIEIDDEYLDFANVNNFEIVCDVVYNSICKKYQ